MYELVYGLCGRSVELASSVGFPLMQELVKEDLPKVNDVVEYVQLLDLEISDELAHVGVDIGIVVLNKELH